MSIYDQEFPPAFEEDATVADTELPEYINDGVDEQAALSPEDQARVEELNRVGTRNTLVVLGGIMLEGAGVYLHHKGYIDIPEMISTSGVAVTVVGVINVMAAGRGIERIRQSYDSRRKK